MYHISFIYSSVDGHLGCFHVLAIVDSASVNPGMYISFWIMVFSGYMPRIGIAGSCMCVYIMISCFSCVWLVAVWTMDYSPPPLSMGFTRQEYWTGRPGNLPNPGTEPSFLCLLHYRQILCCWATGETARLYGSSIFSVVVFLKDIPYCFPQWLHQFTFLPTV